MTTLSCICCGIEITHRRPEALPYCLQCAEASRLLASAVMYLGSGQPQMAADRARNAQEILSDAASYQRGRRAGSGYTWPGMAHIEANKKAGGDA